jgi:hypothetical protein
LNVRREQLRISGVLSCVERDVHRRLIYGNAAIGIVLVLSTITAIVALRSSVQRTADAERIEQRIADLEHLRVTSRDIARAARKYLLNGDLAERERARSLAGGIQDPRKGGTDEGLRLERRLGDYAIVIQRSLSDQRDPGALERFETDLDLVRRPLSEAFDETMATLRARRERSQTTDKFAAAARWALVVAGLLGVSIAAANLLLIKRGLRTAERARSTDRDAEQTIRSKRDLLAASEDLRERLAKVAASAERLRTSMRTAAELRDLESIVGAASHVELRLGQLVDVTAIQLGKRSLTRELLSLAQILERAARRYDELAKKRGVAIRVEPCGSVSAVADRDRIGMVVGALLEQSIEASSSGAQIVMSAASIDEGVRVAVTDVSVSASGARATTTLSVDEVSVQLCQQIVEAHGGRMCMDADAQTRWFTLPSEPKLLRCSW